MSEEEASFDPREAFDWEKFAQFLSQFEDVKKHLVVAGGELLLALRSLIEQVLASLEEEYPQARSKYEFLYAFQYGLGFLGQMVAKSSTGAGDSRDDRDREQRSKRAALESIRAVIEAEIESIRGTGDAEQIRIGAMRAILNVLDREIEKTVSQGHPKAASKPHKAKPRKSRPAPARQPNKA